MPAKRKASKEATAKPKLLTGGNPRIPKADGDEPVQADVAAMPGWKHDVGRHLDALIERTVPRVRKAVRWNTPFFGVEGEGWFLSFHCFDKYVKVAFHNGGSLSPPPPVASRLEHVRYLHIHEDEELEVERLARRVKQASEIPGEESFQSPGRAGGLVAMRTPASGRDLVPAIPWPERAPVALLNRASVSEPLARRSQVTEGE